MGWECYRKQTGMSETDLSGAGWVLNENCYEKLMEEKLKV
jgi:hypothetical protein